MTLLGAIEAGGTKIICAVGTAHDQILKQTRIKTSQPEETMAQVIDFFQKNIEEFGPLEAMGIASFGPLELDENSPHYGQIIRTPKVGWSGVDIPAIMQKNFAVSTGINTDVNAALLGEWKWGAAHGQNSAVYVTIGTGIGMGLMVAGKLVQGRMHPEAGHMLIPQHTEDQDFKGNCAFHGNCLSGLAAGPALEARWGQKAETLPTDHMAWEIEADYLAAMCVNLTVMLFPQKIILGGGVMNIPGLLKKIQQKFLDKMGGYVAIFDHMDDVENYIVPKQLQNPGLSGAFYLAENAPHSALTT